MESERPQTQETVRLDGDAARITPATVPQKRWRRAAVASSVVLAMLITGTGLLPPILLNTTLRNRILSDATGQQGWTVTAGAASGGWVTPFRFSDVRISDPRQQIELHLNALETSQGLMGFLSGSEQIGHVLLIEPRLTVRVAEDGTWPQTQGRASAAQLSFEVVKGAIQVVVPWRTLPIVDVDDLNLQGRIAEDQNGVRTLFVDDTRIFDHEPLSDAHSQQNLALVAPVLSQSTQISGSASVRLDELRIPLEGDQKSPFPIRGTAEFHALNARLRSDWVRQLATLAGSLSQQDLPDHVDVARDCRVDFVITEQGIDHDGMVFLLPEVAKDVQVRSSGMIGLDEHLDLTLSVSLPKVVAAGGPVLSLLSRLAAQPLKVAVKGTVASPELKLPENADFLSEVAQRVAPAQFESEPPPLSQAVSELIRDASISSRETTAQDLTGNVINLIRSISQKTKQKRSADAATIESKSEQENPAAENRRRRKRK